VLIAWNPLFIFESAANAHNDSVMLLFTGGGVLRHAAELDARAFRRSPLRC
jgi:hypothetical protein